MTLPLNVRHHQQDDSQSCGRACAQMVIGFEFTRLGLASGTPLPDQGAMASAEVATLYDQIWVTEPSELATHIANGLLALPSAKTWAVVEFQPTPGLSVDDGKIEVAGSLLDLVFTKLQAGFPSVVMKGSNDHWEVAYNYTEDTANPPNIYLFTIDPLPRRLTPLGTPHSDLDVCARHPDSIWFLSSNATTADKLICNADPFKGSAVGIVQTNPTDWWADEVITIRRGINEVPEKKPAPDPRFREVWTPRKEIGSIRDPLPPIADNMPLIALMNFFKRDLWRMMKAMSELPQPASPFDFDWSRVVVRHVRNHDDQATTTAIVAAPPREGHERSILVSITQQGAVEGLHLTPVPTVFKSLAAAPDEPLWILPKYGQWLPFVRTAQDGAAARFRRLFDGFETEIRTEPHENR